MFGIVLQVIGGFVVTIVLLAMLLLVSLNVSSFVYDLNRVEGYTNYEQDLVYLHQFPRASGKQVPNISPYGIKLETWLRQHKLKYKVSRPKLSISSLAGYFECYLSAHCFFSAKVHNHSH